jgi:hypothetical protein
MSTSSSSSAVLVSEENEQHPSNTDELDEDEDIVRPSAAPPIFATLPVAIKSEPPAQSHAELALSVPPDQPLTDHMRARDHSPASSHRNEVTSSVLGAMEELSEVASSLPSTYGGFGKPQPYNLEQEFRLINLSETLLLETRSSKGRNCIISGKTSKHTIFLQINFPHGYPYKTPPIFTALDRSTLPREMLDEIVQKLEKAAEQVVSKGNRCVDICLRHLEDSLQFLADRERLSVSFPFRINVFMFLS